MNIKMCIQVIRQGSDITLVGWGAQLSTMEQACLDAEKVSGFCTNTLDMSQFFNKGMELSWNLMISSCDQIS